MVVEEVGFLRAWKGTTRGCRCNFLQTMLPVTSQTWASCHANVAGFMQSHHAAREVFLTQQVDNNGVESLWRPAQVCLPDACEKAPGDDVFICEYEYDTVWQVCLALLNTLFSMSKVDIHQAMLCMLPSYRDVLRVHSTLWKL